MPAHTGIATRTEGRRPKTSKGGNRESGQRAGAAGATTM
jgi:hypothetical protein